MPPFIGRTWAKILASAARTLLLVLAIVGLSAQAEPLPVVASFSILADMVKVIGTDRVRVHALVGPEADAHVYTPTPADARHLRSARLVVINGMQFEGWIERLIASSGFRGALTTASDGVVPLYTDDDERSVDPHAWQSLANARIYASNIERGLIKADPAGAEHYRKNAARYREQLSVAERESRARFGAIPAGARRIITTHDAFAYLGRDFGIEFIHLLGLSTDSEASAGELAALIQRIRRERMRALFLENITDPRLLQQAARDAGVRVGGTLYSDALSAKDGPAATYLDMYLHNVEQLVSALRPPR